MMSYFWQAATLTWQWTCWLGVTLFLVFASLLVTPVLAVWLALDSIPKRESKPLTSPTPRRRKLPHPYREGSEIFIEMPDGTVIPLEPMQASILCEEWVDVVKGAYVYEKTKLPDRQ